MVVVGLVTVPLTLVSPGAQAAPVVAGTLVRTIATSAFTPGAPDPSGIAYLPGADRFVVADSEVEETTGAGWHGVNLWRIRADGAVQDTGDTTPYTKEPTGLGFDPATGRLFVSSDSGQKVFVLLPGNDGRYGTTDDVRSVFLASGFGSVDAEDVAFDTRNGHMYIADGTNIEVIDVDPGPGGVFGDGNDTSTSFDMERYGSKDTEGIGYDSVRDTLVVADRATRRLYELSAHGDLVRTIDIRGVSAIRNPADVEIAPSSAGGGRTYWVVDRAIDNGVDPAENDGMLFEIAAPTGSDAPPTVTLGSPAEGATAGGTVSLSATAGDDDAVTKVEFLLDGAVVATDASGADGWSGTWDSRSVGDGPHTMTARATDTAAQTAVDDNAITVDNTAPGVQITSPDGSVVLGGTVTVVATADADAASVAFYLDGGLIGADTNGGDGWSTPWDTVGAADGSHALNAVASDAAGNTGTSSAVGVVVDNPSAVDVRITSSADDAEQKSNTNVVLTSDDLDMMLDGTATITHVGLRFPQIAVPASATITSAYVRFTSDEAQTATTTLTIAAQATGDAPGFVAVKRDIGGRALTTASVTWSDVPGWTARDLSGPVQRTPDLAPVIQEIVARGDWSPGNAIVLVVTGSGQRVARASDHRSATGPLLHIEYESP